MEFVRCQPSPLLLDTRIKRCVLMSEITPELAYAGEVWEEHVKLVKQLETLRMIAAKTI